MIVLFSLLGGLSIVLLAISLAYFTNKNSKKSNSKPLKTYTIIDSYGDKSFIVSDKSLQELLNNLNH